MTPILELGLVYASLTLAGLAARHLRTSAVPFFVAAGMLVGPHGLVLDPLDLRLIRDPAVADILGRIGLLLLLLFVGLELSVPRLLASGQRIVVGGVSYIALNATLSAAFGAALGWPRLEVTALVGIMSISSSAIVARILIDLRRTANPETELILGIITVEDIFLALYLTALSGILLTGVAEPGRLLVGAGASILFIAGVIAVGHAGRRLLDRALADLPQELFLLLIFALVLLIAGAGELLHVAEAVGALLVGLVLAGTTHREAIEERLLPVRDLTAAVFFFAFGASVPPAGLWRAILPALAGAAVTVGGSLAAGLAAGWWAGLSFRASSRMGLTILARGEFSLMVAVVAQRGNLDPRLQPFAALYVLILALASPSLARHANGIADALRRLAERWPGRRTPVPPAPPASHASGSPPRELVGAVPKASDAQSRGGSAAAIPGTGTG
jgi:CPA2 family monovalent cation:H+ antiporter-2